MHPRSVHRTQSAKHTLLKASPGSAAQQRWVRCEKIAAHHKQVRNEFLDAFSIELSGLTSSSAYLRQGTTPNPAKAGTVQPCVEVDAPAYMMLRDRRPRDFALDHYWVCIPGADVVNPTTGEVTTIPERDGYIGGDVTVSQLTKQLGMGPRKGREALVNLGVLHAETEVKVVPMVCDPMQSKPEYSSRLRLSEWAVKMRYGRRVTAGNGYDLDWITPTGSAYINEMLAMSAAPREPPKKEPKAIEVIGQLLAGDPTLRQIDIVRRTGLSKMTVHRNMLLLGKKVTLDRPSVI